MYVIERQVKWVKICWNLTRYRTFYNRRNSGVLGIVCRVTFVIETVLRCLLLEMFVKMFYTNCVRFG
jgi:hypothetical protein